MPDELLFVERVSDAIPPVVVGAGADAGAVRDGRGVLLVGGRRDRAQTLARPARMYAAP